MELVRTLLALGRRAGSRLAGEIKAAPEIKALRRAERLSASLPRFSAGRVALMEYDLRFVDARSLHSQWNEIFVRQGLRFTTTAPAPRIVDCGANIGLASLFFKRAYPAARITAYEADPDVCTILEANLAANGAHDVEVVPSAVWTHSGEAEFRCEGADSGSMATLVSGVDGAIRRVPAVRLRDVIAREEIDLLKLDIEGAEADVIPDCVSVLRNVHALVAELHEFDADRRRTPAVLEALHDGGFDYALTDFCPMPWRGRLAGSDTPFGGSALSWAFTIRAWRSSRVSA